MTRRRTPQARPAEQQREQGAEESPSAARPAQGRVRAVDRAVLRRALRLRRDACGRGWAPERAPTRQTARRQRAAQAGPARPVVPRPVVARVRAAPTARAVARVRAAQARVEPLVWVRPVRMRLVRRRLLRSLLRRRWRGLGRNRSRRAGMPPSLRRPVKRPRSLLQMRLCPEGGRCLAADEVGLALLHERGHALAAVVGGEQAGEELALPVPGPRSRSSSRPPSMASLAARSAWAGPVDVRPDHRDRRVVHALAGRHDPVGEADRQRLLGADHAARHDQVLGPGRADEAGQPLGAAARRG